MKHLTIDEIIDFVSFNKLDSKSLELAARVNAHIFKCATCREKVEAFQIVYDEFVRMNKKEVFKSAVNEKENENELTIQLNNHM